MLIILIRVLLATVRFLGNRPCPRCFIHISQIKDIGSHVDDQRRAHIRVDTDRRQDRVNMSRKWIFEKGRGVNSLNDLLQDDCYIPTRVSCPTLCCTWWPNRLYEECFLHPIIPFWLQLFLAFCTWPPPWIWAWSLEGYFYTPHAYFVCSRKRVYPFIELAVNTFMFEFSFLYLMLLRYRNVPTFGRGTIRRFHTNASAMKKLAGRDFEDLLQVRSIYINGTSSKLYTVFSACFRASTTWAP